MSLQFTGSVTGAGAGVDNVWEQENPEARKCSKMRQNPQRPVHTIPAIVRDAVLGSLHIKNTQSPIKFRKYFSKSSYPIVMPRSQKY
jgi:hypothetical protein